MQMEEFYNSLPEEKKREFLETLVKKCRVSYPTVRGWIAKPGTSAHRTPSKIYRGIISSIMGKPENEVFK